MAGMLLSTHLNYVEDNSTLTASRFELRGIFCSPARVPLLQQRCLVRAHAAVTQHDASLKARLQGRRSVGIFDIAEPCRAAKGDYLMKKQRKSAKGSVREKPHDMQVHEKHS